MAVEAEYYHIPQIAQVNRNTESIQVELSNKPQDGPKTDWVQTVLCGADLVTLGLVGFLGIKVAQGVYERFFEKRSVRKIASRESGSTNSVENFGEAKTEGKPEATIPTHKQESDDDIVGWESYVPRGGESGKRPPNLVVPITRGDRKRRIQEWIGNVQNSVV